MSIYLGLGANDGDRRENLERAIAALVRAGFALGKVSPVVESPALLPASAPSEWHKPYLNLAICGEADWQPQECLAIAKGIEKDLGRKAGGRWSPRPIDIDILRWHEEVVDSAASVGGAAANDEASGLNIPHIAAHQRDFVLTPLVHLQPDLTLGEDGESVFAMSRRIVPLPLWMAVINVTPDSFSDGGQWAEEADGAELDRYLDELVGGNVQVIDVGAESTRPRKDSADSGLEAGEEWARLQPVLEKIAERLRGRRVKPWLSVDSRNVGVVEKALAYGVDLINDVGGLQDREMLALVKDSDCQVVAMHSLEVPPRKKVLPSSPAAHVQVARWAEENIARWEKFGLSRNRVILDTGIGFGKNALQAIDLLAHCREFRALGLRLLVGHSRKSFLRGICGDIGENSAAERDPETLGISLALCQQGVDVLRVHSPLLHMRAHLAWASVQQVVEERANGIAEEEG